jgi:trimethylamine--corrinoid protein Co-methyltransferase
MPAKLQFLTKEDKERIHGSTLDILANTGVRVDTALGRDLLSDFGAEVDKETNIVQFPQVLVEEAVRIAPKQFSLGARRPGWDLPMNVGEITLMGDGEANTVIDLETGEYRPSQFKDWLQITKLLDVVDEVGVYWSVVERGQEAESERDYIRYWHSLFANFSKHVQDGITHKAYAPQLLEVLQLIFGDKGTIRKKHPYSFLLCPQSPLIIDEQYTDAYLALRGWNIPVAVMPMPLKGGTGPGRMISMITQANCEVLAMICLIQAGEPGTPVIYAPAVAAMNPRTGMYSSGSIDNGMMSAAAIEMGRYYNLPVIGSGCGSDMFRPGIQSSYERAMGLMLPVLSRPDILVGPGLFGGSMILSYEQFLIDLEIFRASVFASNGLDTSEDSWLEEIITKAGPGGNYLGERSTKKALKDGRWFLPQMGTHDTMSKWEAAGKPSLLDSSRKRVYELLGKHNPLPLDPDVEKELEKMEKMASTKVLV